MTITDVPHFDVASVPLQDQHEHEGEYRCTPPAFQHIPEASRLTWTDSYFDGVPGIIAVFDRDTLRINAAFLPYLFGMLLLTIFILMLWTLGFWVLTFLYFAVVGYIAWRHHDMWAPQHVAVTEQGVRVDYVGCWNCFSRLGRGQSGDSNAATFLLIPFQQIDFTRREFKFGIVHDSNLHVITVYSHGQKQFDIYGIIRHHDFLDLVMVLKDTYCGTGEETHVPPKRKIRSWHFLSQESTAVDNTRGIV